jgi:hypothetical protein
MQKTNDVFNSLVNAQQQKMMNEKDAIIKHMLEENERFKMQRDQARDERDQALDEKELRTNQIRHHLALEAAAKNANEAIQKNFEALDPQ